MIMGKCSYVQCNFKGLGHLICINIWSNPQALVFTAISSLIDLRAFILMTSTFISFIERCMDLPPSTSC